MPGAELGEERCADHQPRVRGAGVPGGQIVLDRLAILERLDPPHHLARAEIGRVERHPARSPLGDERLIPQHRADLDAARGRRLVDVAELARRTQREGVEVVPPEQIDEVTPAGGTHVGGHVVEGVRAVDQRLDQVAGAQVGAAVGERAEKRGPTRAVELVVGRSGIVAAGEQRGPGFGADDPVPFVGEARKRLALECDGGPAGVLAKDPVDRQRTLGDPGNACGDLAAMNPVEPLLGVDHRRPARAEPDGRAGDGRGFGEVLGSLGRRQRADDRKVAVQQPIGAAQRQGNRPGRAADQRLDVDGLGLGSPEAGWRGGQDVAPSPHTERLADRDVARQQGLLQTASGPADHADRGIGQQIVKRLKIGAGCRGGGRCHGRSPGSNAAEQRGDTFAAARQLAALAGDFVDRGVCAFANALRLARLLSRERGHQLAEPPR